MNVISVGDSFGHAWSALWANFLPLLIIGMVALLLLAPGSIMGEIGSESEGFVAFYFGLSAFLCHVLLRGPIEYGVKYVYLRAARDQSVSVPDMLEGFRNFANVILANLLVALVVGVGLILFVVPGIVFACKLAFVPYLVVESRMNALDALQESWRMTTGCASQIFLVGVLAIPICIAGLLCLGFGIVISIMWIRMTFAAIYEAVDSFEQERDELALPG